MRKAGAIVSLIAGVLGVLFAFITLAAGGLAGAFGAKNASTVVGLGWGGVFFSILVIVFAAIAFTKPKFSGWALIVCSVLGAILGGTMVAIVMLLSLVGGVLCLLDPASATPKQPSDTTPVSTAAAAAPAPRVAPTLGPAPWSNQKLTLLSVLSLVVPFFAIGAGLYGLTQPQNRSRAAMLFGLGLLNFILVGALAPSSRTSAPPSAALVTSPATASEAAPRNQVFTLQSAVSDHLPAAPYSVEAHQRLTAAAETVGQPQRQNTDQETFKSIVDAMDELYRKAGYSLQKSLVTFITDLERLGHPPLTETAEGANAAYVALASAAETGIQLETLFRNPSAELRKKLKHFPNQSSPPVVSQRSAATTPENSRAEPQPNPPAAPAFPVSQSAQAPAASAPQRIAPTESAASRPSAAQDPCESATLSANLRLECLSQKLAAADAAVHREYQRLATALTREQRALFGLQQLEWEHEAKHQCKTAAANARAANAEIAIAECRVNASLERAKHLAKFTL